jgi:curved DNA-binding protein CbpA
LIPGVLAVRPAGLEGAIGQGALVTVLRGLFLGKLTGLLRLQRADETLLVRFVSGRIVSASSGAIRGRLGQILVRIGRLEPRDLASAIAAADRAGRPLGSVLVEAGLVCREQVEDALRLQVREILLTGLFWESGSYSFEFDLGVVDGSEDVSLDLPTPQVILEVVGAMTDAEAVRHALGDLDRPVAAAADPPLRLGCATLNPGDGYVLSRADGSMSAREILAAAPVPAGVVERSLLGLLCTGVIQSLPKHARRRPASPAPPPRERREPPPQGAASPELDVEEISRRLACSSHHEALGLPPTASAEEVKSAFFALVKRYHPDSARGRGSSALVQAMFHRVCQAYNALRSVPPRTKKDPASRPAGKLSPAPDDRISNPASPAPAPAPPAPASPLDSGSFVGPAEAIDRAERLVAAGNAWEATAVLRMAIPSASGRLRDRGRVLLARALVLSPQGTRAAESELRSVVQESPEYIRAHLELASIYKETGRSLLAAGAYRRVLELSPGHRQAQAELERLPPSPRGSSSSFSRRQEARG